MSSLSAYAPESLRRRFGLLHFVETGCSEGDGIETAIEAGFSTVWSCDISEQSVERCRARFFGSGAVRICQLDSLTFLRRIVGALEGPTLFWLDAHFPSVFGLHELEQVHGRFPLAQELQIIATMKKDVGSDVLIADDLRVIADPSNPRWRLGELPEELVIRDLSIANLCGPFRETHELILSTQAEGAIIVIPK